MKEKQPIQLGSKVVDSITKFSGVATARITYLQGDTQWLVEKGKNDGDGISSEWIREDRLTVKS